MRVHGAADTPVDTKRDRTDEALEAGLLLEGEVAVAKGTRAAGGEESGGAGDLERAERLRGTTTNLGGGADAPRQRPRIAILTLCDAHTVRRCRLT